MTLEKNHDHGHGHGHHGHAHPTPGPNDWNRAFAIGIVLNLGFVVVEALYGWKAGSLALLADAGHNLSDVAGLILAWGAALAGRLAPTRQRTPSTPAAAAVPEAMQAALQATLAPWAPQPVQQARATLRAVNLATLWPQAPATRLNGALQAGPTADQGTPGWAVQAQINNELAGPWDQSRLPLTALVDQFYADVQQMGGNRWDTSSLIARFNKK